MTDAAAAPYAGVRVKCLAALRHQTVLTAGVGGATVFALLVVGSMEGGPGAWVLPAVVAVMGWAGIETHRFYALSDAVKVGPVASAAVQLEPGAWTRMWLRIDGQTLCCRGVICGTLGHGGVREVVLVGEAAPGAHVSVVGDGFVLLGLGRLRRG